MTSRSKTNKKTNIEERELELDSDTAEEKVYVFPALLDGVRLKQGSFHLTFEIDESLRSSTNAIVDNAMGTNFVIVAYRMTSTDKLASALGKGNKAVNDFSAYNRNKLMKQLHGIIGTYSEDTGSAPEVIKNKLKAVLFEDGIDVTSFSELTDADIARAIFLLRTKLHPARTSY